MVRPPVALSVAGSDPSGGAGIQADLKTFSALGAYGTTVVTALTAQSTRGVSGVHPVPPPFVEQQLRTLVADVRVDVVKVGMLATAALVRAVDGLLRSGPLAEVPVVLDPVMVATSGHRLLDIDAVRAMRDLADRADVLTPNLPEALVLLGLEPRAASRAEMPELVRRLGEVGARAVLLKGGHLDEATAPDLWSEGGELTWLETPRVRTTSTHGTGCSLSSAIAALLPRHAATPAGRRAAVTEAKGWLTGALRAADRLEVGGGHGPVHHFHEEDVSARWRHI